MQSLQLLFSETHTHPDLPNEAFSMPRKLAANCLQSIIHEANPSLCSAESPLGLLESLEFKSFSRMAYWLILVIYSLMGSSVEQTTHDD